MSLNSFIHDKKQLKSIDCFVDANEDLAEKKSPDDKLDELDEHNVDGKSLKTRLEETTVILRMALNNEFVRALEICTQR